MPIPRTTHQWLKPLYDVLEGRTARPLQLGSPTGPIGFYGSSGGLRLATTSLRSTGGFTGGASGAAVDSELCNGGTGTYYSRSDIVRALKNVGIILP